jgi:iron-sulfur cluster assembly protein
MNINITTTPAARAFVLKQRPSAVLKIGIKRTGCSGFAYTFNTVEQPMEVDQVFPQEGGLTICVDPEALKLFASSVTLDYVKNGLNQRLELINPNEKNRCGCGESVQF